MARAASRELRNETRRLLERVEAGEDVTITVDGRDVAVLRPLPQRKQWLSKQEWTTRLAGAQADHQLTAELASLAPDPTDDLDPLE